MTRMPSQTRRNLFAVFVTLLIVFEMIAYVATTPRPREQFFQIYVLGSNRLAADYYPNDDPNIRRAETVRWYLGVTNFMGNVQLAAIRVKLGNQTILPPDDREGVPSQAPLVTEYRRFIQNNETWEFPFVWQISNVITLDDYAYIQELVINEDAFDLQGPPAKRGHNFRLIIELWTWEVDSESLQFGWIAGGERRAAWLQVWFNATTTLR